MGKGRSGKISGRGAKERKRKGSSKQEEARTYDQAKKHGFENAAQLQAFVDQRYWSENVSPKRKNGAFTIEEAPSFMGKDVAVIRMGDRNDTQSFLQYLNNELNVMTAQWQGDIFSRNSSYFVYLDRKADNGKKKQKLK